MLVNARPDGLGLLTLMAHSAAANAGTRLARPFRLARCDALDLREGFAADDVSLESWPVSGDGRTIIISVFATAPQDGGGTRMAGTGRFTFTTLIQTKEYHA